MNSDHAIPRIVVATLAAVVIIGVAAMSYLATTQTPIPDQLDRLVVGAMGALGAILATTRAAGDPPAEVQVVNEADEPVPVEAT